MSTKKQASGAIGWLRQRFSGESPPGESPPELPGRAARKSAADAVAASEALICETVCGSGGAGPETTGRETVAEASGLAMAGVRTAALVDASGLDEARGALGTAARRRLPLVVHATFPGAGSVSSHAAYHAVADCGAFLALAGNPQEAVDLTLVARRLAEVALVPGIVAIEEGHEEELLLPEPELVRRYLGAADDEFACPTAAQTMLFGERRRTLPRFFDLDRPAALGLGAEGRDLAASLAGQQLFFADSVAPLALSAMADLEALTGRRLSFLSDHHLEGARQHLPPSVPPRGRRHFPPSVPPRGRRHFPPSIPPGGRIFLAQGAAIGVAAQLAAQEDDVGVLGLGWLRPFPADALRAALAEAESVTVLEAAGDQLAAGPPLLRELSAVLPPDGPHLVSALYRAPLEPAELAALLAGDPRPSVWLGATAPSAEADGHPRREALVQRLRREYPELDQRALAAPRPAPEDGGAEPELPMAVRRFTRGGSTWDNVARFWGELVQPRNAAVRAPDPYLALGAVPAATATFFDHTAERDQVPVIDPEACTGCGRCWTFCPDSAIASVAIDTASLLDAAADRADAAGGEAVPKKLRRAFKQIAGRLDSRLASSADRILTREPLVETFEWLLGKMKLDDEEREAFSGAAGRIAAEILELPLAATDAFFRRAHQEKKGSGELLLLAVDPRACQGCGICAAVCDDDAVACEPQTPEAVARMRSLQRVWEGLPDTPGRSIARAAELPEVGALPAILMSRHCLLSTSGGDGAEPGSGQRLGVRQVTAIAEYHMQRRLLAHAETLQELAGKLRQAVHDTLSQALPAGDLDVLDQALDAAPQHAGNLGTIVARLEQEPGEHPGVDTPAVRKLIRSVKQIEALHREILEGASGAGRARFGLVVAGTVAEWAARFPRNPFSVPLAADPDGDGSQLARGIARALLGERLQEVRLVRRAEARLAAASDLPEREQAIDALTPEDLAPEELRLTPPVLLFADGRTLAGQPLGSPVKVVLLDDRQLPVGPEPVLSALALRRAFVLASSVAHPEHLFDGVTAALEFPGPALVHVHAPSPRRHGFPAENTVDRARLAVDSRVQPLVRYDPRRDGVFGRRLDLAGNPALEETWARDEDGEALTPERWLAGEERFARLADPSGVAREREETWATLQELSGVVTPFTERLRAEVEEQHAQTHQAEIEALRAEYEARIARLEADQHGTQAAALRDRLMQLAGYRRPPAGEP